MKVDSVYSRDPYEYANQKRMMVCTLTFPCQIGANEECRCTASHRRMSALNYSDESPQFPGADRRASDLGGMALATFFLAGFVNVVADHPDPDIVNWALVRVR